MVFSVDNIKSKVVPKKCFMWIAVSSVVTLVILYGKLTDRDGKLFFNIFIFLYGILFFHLFFFFIKDTKQSH